MNAILYPALLTIFNCSSSGAIYILYSSEFSSLSHSSFPFIAITVSFLIHLISYIYLL
nr:MAG TPA: hypothetical protein [Caudoviricetes sp.]